MATDWLMRQVDIYNPEERLSVLLRGGSRPFLGRGILSFVVENAAFSWGPDPCLS